LQLKDKENAGDDNTPKQTKGRPGRPAAKRKNLDTPDVVSNN